MGAFSIAFDTIIVGSLALTWVLLVLHLFFSDKELSIGKLLDWVSKQNQPAVAGVLLFAMAYSLGSAVSRIAQDFFDDDDMHFRIDHVLFRVGVTESSIRTDVYCRTADNEAPKPGDPPFVKVGDSVEPGQVLCIIESMKLMNEIEAETGGTIVAKLVENGRPVEYGEALFSIRPR